MNATGERLKGFIERIERLEEEKKDLQRDIRDVKSEAKAHGFDIKTINALIALRKMDPLEREEHEALLDIYKAALGMLYDTPLGEAARRRLAKPEKDDRQSDIEDLTKDPVPDLEPPSDDVDIDGAREMGTKAAQDGQPVTRNPFPPNDPRRAAWDESWCAATGSDGMDIPEAWRRKKPEKPEKEGEEDGREDKS